MTESEKIIKLNEVCDDLDWECGIVLDMVILALREKRFRVLAPTKEEWFQIRTKPDAIEILSKRLNNITGRHWEHEEIVEFKEQIELEYFRPARETISFETKIQLLFNKEQKCAICGINGIDMIPEIDHKKPVVKGGASQYSNLQWLCRSCNRTKHAKVGKEWKNA